MATSASLRTTNYELRKYASMDEVKVLQDFNVNMDLIDGAVHTVAETLDVAAGVVSDNVTRLDGLDDSVGALQTAVNTANTTANSALSASGTANSSIALINALLTKYSDVHTAGTNVTFPTNNEVTRVAKTIVGNATITTSGAIAAADVICTVPAGYRPSGVRTYGSLLYTDAGVRMCGIANIDNNGLVTTRQALPSSSNAILMYSYQIA